MSEAPAIWHQLRESPAAWIEAERLRLRPPHADDAEAFNALLVQAWQELHLWMEWAAAEQPPAVEETAEVIASMAANREAGSDSTLLILDRDGHEILGSTGYHRIDWTVPRLEIGYWIAPRFQSRGLGTEAVIAATDFAFRTFGAERMEIRCAATNPRSSAVARRAGYVHEATLTNDRRHHLTGELDATEIYTKLRHEPLH